MTQYIADYITDVRGVLQDESATSYRWTDAELTNHIHHAVRVISKHCPAEKKTALAVTASSKEVDISSLTGRVYIDKCEYKPDLTTPAYRNFKEWGDVLTIDIASAPSASTSEGTLTGTVTFATGSTAVTGVGTAFDTELEVGDYIRDSGGTEWYKVSAIASATALTLATASNDDGADTLDSTLYGSNPVCVYYTEMHAVAAAATTIPVYLENLVIDGAVAYAALAWISKGADRILEAINKFTNAETAIGDVTARVTKGLEDLTSGRAYIAKEHTAADTAIDKMSDRIKQALADLATGADLINKVNKGGVGVPTDWANYAGSNLQVAVSHLNQAKGFMAEDQPAAEYLNFAARELQSANTYLGQSQAYLSEITGKLNVASIVARYQGWANDRLVLFMRDVRGSVKPRKHHTYSDS